MDKYSAEAKNAARQLRDKITKDIHAGKYTRVDNKTSPSSKTFLQVIKKYFSR